ncbi:hypothetical protein ACEXAJ_02485 [Fusobacterium necrophorum subsp. funduliforme]
MLVSIPIFLYLLLMLYIAFQVNKKKRNSGNFAEEYYKEVNFICT